VNTVLGYMSEKTKEAVYNSKNEKCHIFRGLPIPPKSQKKLSAEHDRLKSPR